MKNPNIRSINVVLVLFMISTVKCRELKKLKNVSMFIFGDSLYDPGNGNDLNISILDKANYWPYGETFFNFSTGRFCDGRNIPDFIAIETNLPIWKPYLDVAQNFSNGANFAAGGAGVLSETNPKTITLRKQMGYFEKVASQLMEDLGEENAKNILMESVYLSSIGGNDYPQFYAANPNATQSEIQAVVQLVIRNLSDVIKEMYEIGGRKFAFQNVAPLGCLPWVKVLYGETECVEGLQAYARLHNKFLLQAVLELESELEGFQYSMFDYFTLLSSIIQNPEDYGFKVSNAGCCSGETKCGLEPYEKCNNTSEYVFFDNAHPTEAANLLLFKLAWNDNNNFTTPLNFKQLFDLQNIFNLPKSNNNVEI